MGVTLARHRLHRLADEEAEQRFLARLVLFDLIGIVGEDLGHRRVDRAGIRSLLEALGSTIAAARSPVSSKPGTRRERDYFVPRTIGDIALPLGGKETPNVDFPKRQVVT